MFNRGWMSIRLTPLLHKGGCQIPLLVKLLLSHKRCTGRLSVFVYPFLRVVLVAGIECHCICDDRAAYTASRISPISCITRTLIAKSGPEHIAFSVIAWVIWFRFRHLRSHIYVCRMFADSRLELTFRMSPHGCTPAHRRHSQSYQRSCTLGIR